MPTKLTLSQIHLGMLDARSELLVDWRDSTDLFRNSYLVLDNVNVDDFHSGKFFFITGLKGSGKTALLLYTSMDAIKQSHDASFIFFKSDITEEDKQNLSRAVGFEIVKDGASYRGIEQDYENAWRWFFHQKLSELLSNPDQQIVQSDQHLKTYLELSSRAKKDQKSARYSSILPKFKDGKVKISADLGLLSGGLEADFSFSKESPGLPVGEFLKLCDKGIERLTAYRKKLFIYIDELEIFFGSEEQYQRDCRLIRDLIVTVFSFNRRFIEKRIPIIIICAVRSEVLGAVESLGKEINKPVSDFGIPITWHMPKTSQDHPLLRVIAKKIEASELKHFGKIVSRDPWRNYFPAMLHDDETQRWLLHNTWYRPRDLIRMLNLAAKKHPSGAAFTQATFDDTKELYAKQSWVELTEELQANYSARDIDAMKIILLGSSKVFVLENLEMNLERKKKLYRNVGELLEKRSIEEILSDLFNIGVIGNVYGFYGRERRFGRGRDTKVRWVFRGDTSLLLEKQMAVHRGLWKFLSIVE